MNGRSVGDKASLGGWHVGAGREVKKLGTDLARHIGKEEGGGHLPPLEQDGHPTPAGQCRHSWQLGVLLALPSLPLW